jgi:choline dehydrogenase-like flavoprotein
VRFRRHKKDQIAKAHREVILSAGAIASPQILMLSGIGPADHLRYHGIPVRADLPVGKSLQSHVGTGEVVFSVKKKVSYDPRRYFTNPGVNVIFNVLSSSLSIGTIMLECLHLASLF